MRWAKNTLSPRCVNVLDYRSLAKKRLPRPVFDFLDGGAEDEVTLARNRDGFCDWMLVPYALRDVSRVDTSTTMLGQKLDWPMIVGPTGMPGLFHPDAEIGVAKAAAETGALYTLSTMASCSIEEVAAATNGAKAFQLYLFRDRGITRELLQRARDAGYTALILTVDIQVPANRERDRRSGMTIPPRLGLHSILQFSRHPRWCWNTLIRRPVTLANFAERRANPGTTLLNFINDQFDPNTTWKDVEWVAGLWNGPLAVKGILRGSDALMAARSGAVSVILSNHGGRQMDTAVAPIDVLDEFLQELDGAAETILDGGIRRGTDMLKALALGATGTMTGRVGLYGLAADGVAGATSALGLLKTEYERGMKLLGTRTRQEIDRSCIRRK